MMDGTRYIVAGGFIDGSGAAVRRNIFLAVKDSLISGIGSAAELAEHDKAAIDDLSHCTILPALVDCSLSLLRSPSVPRSGQVSHEQTALEKRAAMVERHIHYCHTHGVLGVADSDDYVGLGGLAPGTLLDIRSSGRLCRSYDECADGIALDHDFVKIAYSGNIEDEQAPQSPFSHEDLCRILQHKGQKKAVVVANGRQRVTEALAAGCDAIEQGYGMGEENLRKMAEKNVLWIPSALRAKSALDTAGSGGSVCCRFSQRYVAPGKALPGAEALWKKILAEHLKKLRFARELGVKTAVGTGAGSVGILHGESMVEEMKLFIKAGYSLEETICCASENGARFFGMERLGALTVGRKATFLISRGSVKQLPRKLSYLEGIYIDGAPSRAYRKNPVKTV